MEKMVTKKRESGISRVVGVEESVERELLNYFKKQFEKDQKSAMEQEHTPELDRLISEVNGKMKEFMAGYSVEALDVPSRNVHVIDKSKLSQQQLKRLKNVHKTHNGFYVTLRQQVVILNNYVAKQRLFFAQTLAHEMIHANAFGSVQKVKDHGVEIVKDGDSIRLTTRRLGFEIDSKKTGLRFFHDINEAITTELTIRFDQRYFSEFEDLKQEYEERRKVVEVAARIGGEGKYLGWPIANSQPKEGSGGREVIVKTYSYGKERKGLNELIDDLYEKNKSEFQSREDVFTLFAKAALNGQLLQIARLIEKTYGKGSFRKLGEKTAQ